VRTGRGYKYSAAEHAGPDLGGLIGLLRPRCELLGGHVFGDRLRVHHHHHGAGFRHEFSGMW